MVKTAMPLEYACIQFPSESYGGSGSAACSFLTIVPYHPATDSNWDSSITPHSDNQCPTACWFHCSIASLLHYCCPIVSGTASLIHIIPQQEIQSSDKYYCTAPPVLRELIGAQYSVLVIQSLSSAGIRVWWLCLRSTIESIWRRWGYHCSCLPIVSRTCT